MERGTTCFLNRTKSSGSIHADVFAYATLHCRLTLGGSLHGCFLESFFGKRSRDSRGCDSEQGRFSVRETERGSCQMISLYCAHREWVFPLNFFLVHVLYVLEMCEQHSQKVENMESWRSIYREKISHHSADASAALQLLLLQCTNFNARCL